MKHFLPLILICSMVLRLSAQTFTLNYQNTDREFIVHLPTGYTAGSHLPLVFNHHGYTSNASQQMLYSNMNATADANNFIVVYPNGLNASWNSGFLPPYNGTSPDDVGFISKIIDTMYTLYGIDPARVYSCGMSNGGYQSYRLACDLENRIAAIASVTGSMTTNMTSNCALSRRVPTLEIHGTDDPTVPYNGTSSSLGTDSVFEFWADKNNCISTPETTGVANTNTTDGSTVLKIKYKTCSNGTQVWLYKVIGGGHTWPGATINIGVTNKDINASQEIWDFFKLYTLNGSATGIAEAAKAIELNVYPNPASSTVNVEADEYMNNISVYNLLGEKVMERNLNSTAAQLNIEDLHSGIYLLSIKADGNTYTKRFTKE
ncbi:MAG: T9SS type A sorting domain-containing protein [Bacteroidetes bacterium]|nr:T9SS type A sorting domain-containing protein [Bacteroidota bacterium]